MDREEPTEVWILEVELNSIHLRFAEVFERSGISLLSRVQHNQGKQDLRPSLLYRHQMRFVLVASWNIAESLELIGRLR